jgi:hypothetical protein
MMKDERHRREPSQGTALQAVAWTNIAIVRRHPRVTGPGPDSQVILSVSPGPHLCQDNESNDVTRHAANLVHDGANAVAYFSLWAAQSMGVSGHTYRGESQWDRHLAGHVSHSTRPTIGKIPVANQASTATYDGALTGPSGRGIRDRIYEIEY